MEEGAQDVGGLVVRSTAEMTLASADVALPRLWYTLWVVFTCLRMVLEGAIAMRASARLSALMLGSAPAHTTVRWWLLRLGYYKLMRPKPKGTWIWLVDHSIQMGTTKVLVIAGVLQEKLPPIGQALTLRDLEPLAVLPVTTSNGPVVDQQLQDVVRLTGVPRAILADQGSDLKAGIRTFCKRHRKTTQIVDIKHKVASLLKKHLNETNAWAHFCTQAAACKRELQQSELALLAPPNQRSKSRYMNADILTKWAMRKLRLLRKRKSTLKKIGVVRDDVKRELGWLEIYRPLIKDWAAAVQIGEKATAMIRTTGYYRGATKKVKRDLRGLSTGPISRTMRRDVLAFIGDQETQAKLQPSERLPGSTEAIESLFGKYKHIEGDHASQGFTALVLAIAAVLGETTIDVVHSAMTTVKTVDVINWARLHLGRTLGSMKRRLKKLTAE